MSIQEQSNTVTVKYLASLIEKLDKSSETLVFAATDSTLTVAAVWDILNPEVIMPANTICAINFQYATLESQVQAGDELAFFPPVTGG